MSYTITISGHAEPGDGQSAEQLDADVASKAKALVGQLPGVSAAFLQTTTGGMTDLAAPTTATQETP